MVLKGKTILVSGGIKGLGLEIVRELSRNQANIVIIGKSVHPHPDMPDTIYSAAEEAEELGAVALPVQVDVRFDDQIQKALVQAMDTFGQLDACINLASVCHKGTIGKTSMPTYDLINQINVRGAYMLARFSSEYLSESKNPHIVNFCPPLDLFNEQTASISPVFLLSKIEQSYTTLAMAAEFKEKKIGVNAIWPKCKLQGAEEFFIGEAQPSELYKSDITAKAIVELIQQNSSQLTGNLFYDDEFLDSLGQGLNYDDFKADVFEEAAEDC